MMYNNNMTEDVSLKEYLNSRIDDVKDSVKTAYASMEKRLEGMNEFRDQLKDQATRFVTRDEVGIKTDTIQKQVDDLRLSRATLEGKASQQSVNVTLFISLIGIILSVISIILKFFGSSK